LAAASSLFVVLLIQQLSLVIATIMDVEGGDISTQLMNLWRSETLAPDLLPFAFDAIAVAKETIDEQVHHSVFVHDTHVSRQPTRLELTRCHDCKPSSIIRRSRLAINEQQEVIHSFSTLCKWRSTESSIA
jgi:hypothetical protein